MTTTHPTLVEPARVPRIPWLRILGWFVVSRLLILLVAKLALLGIAAGPHFMASHFQGPPNVLQVFVRWDAGWYLGIAQHGYSFTPGAQSSVVFLPAFPMLMRGLAWVIGDFPLAGVLIANLCLIATCGIMWRFASQVCGSVRAADDAVAIFLLSPVAFFFSAIYSESLFLLLMVAAMWQAHQGRWLVAGLCGFFAALTRSVGFLLVIPMVWEWMRQRPRVPLASWRGRVFDLACCALPAAGLAGYFLYLHFRFHDFFAYVHAQAFWYQAFTSPVNTFHNTYVNLPLFYRWWFTVALVAAGGAIAVGIRLRLLSTQLVLVLTFTGFYLCKNHLDSLPRYLSIVYPFYFIQALALQRWPKAGKWIWGVNGMLLTFSTILFASGYYFS